MVFTKLENKKIETTGVKSGWGRPARTHSAPALGPNQEPNTSGFNFLIFEFREYHLRQEPNTLDFNFLILVSHEYHLRFSSFHVKIFVNTIQNFLTTQWNPGHKIKKICAVFIEIPHWWFFAKNTAVTFYNVQITNLVTHCLGTFQSSYLPSITYLFKKV